MHQPVFASKYYIDSLKNYQSINFIRDDKYSLDDITSFYTLIHWHFNHYAEKNKGTIRAESAFVEVMKYYSDFVDRQNKRINLNNIFDNKNDEFLEYQNSLYLLGLMMWYDNNSCYYVMSNKYIYENFAPYLSQEWQELLKYETYFDKQIVSDGKYVIPKKEVEQIIKFYKDFSVKYPEFSKKHGINKRIKLFEKSLKKYPYTTIADKI